MPLPSLRTPHAGLKTGVQSRCDAGWLELFAGATRDNLALRELSRKLRARVRCEAAAHVQSAEGMSERRACWVRNGGSNTLTRPGDAAGTEVRVRLKARRRRGAGSATPCPRRRASLSRCRRAAFRGSQNVRRRWEAMSSHAALIRLSVDREPLGRRLQDCAASLWTAAASHDRDGADPEALCAPLGDAGLFIDALPEASGGLGLATGATAPLLRVLLAIGGADLSAGRIFEGHVNAVKLVVRYGSVAQQTALAQDVHAGAVCGVWNAEASPGLRLLRTGGASRLEGSKIYASGLGLVTRPVITARLADGGVQMFAPRLERAPQHDLSGWTVRGMRATATGAVGFTGIEVADGDAVGAPGDYYRAPLFKGGAWRFAAVQTGAVLRLARLFSGALAVRERAADPHQKARVASVAIAAQTAELWVARAAALAEAPDADPDAADAYVNLARLAVERAALEVVAVVERGVGLAAFTRPDPIERVVRDLTTYLRQPYPDKVAEEAADYVARAGGAPPWSAASEAPA